jgi:membrane-bound inhibitor of C-type lysozyme
MIAVAVLSMFVGCASFTTTRQGQYMDMNGQVIHVEYGKEKHTTKLSNGLTFTFENKVRITLPDGDRAVLYETMSTSGLRYASHDEKYVFNEKGPYCLLYVKGQLVFEGLYRRH